MATRSQATTRGIRVTVRSAYVPERSHPEQQLWFFAYQVELENQGAETVRLVSRHWVITDAEERTEEVRGPGVVGEKPELSPGQSFRYSSACPLRTCFGTMFGSYQMVNASGEAFDVEIAPFALSIPYSIH